jgi:hypothetical protein
MRISTTALVAILLAAAGSAGQALTLQLIMSGEDHTVPADAPHSAKVKITVR